MDDDIFTRFENTQIGKNCVGDKKSSYIVISVTEITALKPNTSNELSETDKFVK